MNEDDTIKMVEILYNTYSIKDLHKKLDIDEKYKSVNLHIALERADLYKDKDTFIKLYNLSPIILKNHIDMTDEFFEWTFKNDIYFLEK